jgi:hypothetical protein
MGSYDYVAQPIYISSPSSDWQGPQVLPPNGQSTFNSDAEAELAVLNIMAHPGPAKDGTIDPTAGLYKFDKHFDPQSSNPKDADPSRLRRINDAENAWNQLSKNHDPENPSDKNSLFFKSPGGDWQKLETLQDLKIYMFHAPEAKDQAPAPDPSVTAPMGDPVFNTNPQG